MNGEQIFWPMLCQVALTYVIYGVGSSRRMNAIKSGNAKPSDFRVPTVEPEPSATAMRNLTNQFELPVLFYACCLTLFVLGATSTIALALGWAFALLRVAHAYVHVTSNKLRYRRPLFIAGFFVLAAMWLMVLYRLAIG